MMNPTLSRNLRKSFFQTCFLRSSTLQPRRSPFIFRAASTSVKESVPSAEVLKPNLKPKTATQLRRSASASLPIRSNPTPTRSEIQPVSIITTAERYILPQLKLPRSAVRLHESWWIPKWGLNKREGEVFVFENGSVVCWGLSEQDAQSFARKFIDRKQVEVEHLKEPETEDVEFVTDPNELSP